MLDRTLPGAAARPSPAYHRHHARPVLVVLGVFALLFGGALGSELRQPGNLLASSRSSQQVLQDTDSHIVWSSGWMVRSSRSASGGSVHYSGKAGASATVVYYGAYLKLLAPTGQGAGVFRATVDGKATTLVSTHGNVFHMASYSLGRESNRTFNDPEEVRIVHPAACIDVADRDIGQWQAGAATCVRESLPGG